MVAFASTPPRDGWAEGKAEAARRYPRGRASGDAPAARDDAASDDDIQTTTAEHGRAAARARIAARRA